MLSRELMGLALLGLSWMTGLMIALDALIDARSFRALLRGWKTSLRQVTVKSDELATHEVEQRVKELDSETPGLVFFDRKHTGTVKGGEVELDGKVVTLSGAAGAEVWFDAATRVQNAACTGAPQFDAMLKTAQGAGGGIRHVKSTLRAGQSAWVAGTLEGDTFTASLVSNFDPRTFARARLWASYGVVLASTAWVALGTFLALWQPVFGLVSILGAITLVAHFLGMTPLAMTTREKSRLPSVAYVRGTWRRDEVQQEAALPGAVNPL
jgi:hypothetical protein